MLIPLIPIDEKFTKQSVPTAIRMICEAYIRKIGAHLLTADVYDFIIGSHSENTGGAVRITAQFDDQNTPSFVLSFTPVVRLKTITNELIFTSTLQLFQTFRKIWVKTQPQTRLLVSSDVSPYVTPEQQRRIDQYTTDPRTNHPTILDNLIFMELIVATLVLDIRTDEAGAGLWAAVISDPHTVLIPMLRLAQPGILINFIST